MDISNLTLSIYLDKVNIILSLLLPLWPLIRYRNTSVRKMLLIAPLLWVFFYCGEMIIFKLSGYFGVKLFCGIWLYFGLPFSLVYTSMLNLVANCVPKTPTDLTATKVIDTLYMTVNGGYLLFLIWIWFGVG